MNDTTVASALAFYARHSCALFPIPTGSKSPVGIVQSFAHDHSADLAQWEAWHAEHNCNFGLVAGPSRLIIADVDVSEIGRERAWAIWQEWWTSRGLPVPQPQSQSARGGWHTLFAVPEHVDIATLRQVPLIGPTDGSKKAIVDLRVGNGFVVAAGSFYDGTAKGEQSGSYILFPDAPAPHPCPDALLASCARSHRQNVTVRAGFADPDHTDAVLRWMTERGCFDSYHTWIEVGMILRCEFGDDPGFALWQLTNDGTCSAEDELKKWESFSSELSVDDVKIGTLRKRAKDAGCKLHIGICPKKMFGNVVAQIAADAGAKLPLPPLPGGQSLAGNTQKVIADLGQPVLDVFLDSTNDVPLYPVNSNFPQLPSACEESYPAIFEQMNTTIARIVAMAETPKSFKQQRVWRVLAVLHHMHQATYQAVVDRINALGSALTDSKLQQHNKQFEIDILYNVQGKNRTSFHADSKNKPDPAISDNVGIFLTLSGHRVRWDTFPKRAEVACGEDEFARFDQDELDRLWMLAKSADYNYHPAKDVFRSGVKVEAKSNCYDSLEDKIFELSRKWDGISRLETWLSRCVGVADDNYHRAVGRNLIGGMIRRAREHGCKQDETVIFISPEQGTGKSTLCRILALDDDWFLGKFKFGQSDQSSLPLLAGKWVVELGELAGLNKTDFEDVKSFLSETRDEYVAKYESEPTVNPRRCVFIGTSNIRQPLGDPSGNRRFLPVHVAGEIDLAWLRENIEQLIGEAARRHESGESFAIPRDVWEATKAAQEAARNMSPIEEACYNWFDRQGSFYVLSADLANALRMAGLGAGSRVGVFMEKMGWRKAQVGRDRERVWIKHANNDIVTCVQMIPAQQTPTGRVEMRLRMASPPY